MFFTLPLSGARTFRRGDERDRQQKRERTAGVNQQLHGEYERHREHAGHPRS